MKTLRQSRILRGILWCFPLAFALGPVLLLLFLLLTGCTPSRQGARAIDPAPTLSGQQTKDDTVLTEADAIDAKVSGSPLAGEVRVSTDKQRAAVAAAPAADVARLIEAYVREDERKTALLAAQAKEIAKLKRERDEAKAGVWRQVQFYGSLALYAVAIGGLVLAAFRAKAAISSGLAVIEGIKSTITLVTLSATCFTVARFMAAWWFWWACGAIVVGFVAYVAWLAVMERRGKAAANALTPVRRVLDRIYDEAEPSLKADLDRHIFEPLSEEMVKTPGAKTYIHLDRATAR